MHFGSLSELGDLAYFPFSCLPLSARSLRVSTLPSISLTAVDVDGVNTGTLPLGFTLTLTPTITNISDTGVIWRVQGSGSITDKGVYWPPTRMPSNSTVTVVATLEAYSTVSASYQFTLVNPVPVATAIVPAQLVPAETNIVQILGSHFVPGTTVLLNGQPVPTRFNGSSMLEVQVPVAASGGGPILLQAQTSGPGGGATVVLQAAIAPESISLTASDSDGTNTGTARLAGWSHIVPSVTAPGDRNLSWSISGAGSLSSGGWYTSPLTMPTDPNVTITTTLVANPAVSSSYQFQLINAVPVIRQINPQQLPTATTDSVRVIGTGFVPGTAVLINGIMVPSSYQSPTYVIAQVPVPDNAQAPITIQAVNPTPGGGQSQAFQAPVKLKTIEISGYNLLGTNPLSVPLDEEVQFVDFITSGPGDPQATWSVQGGGTISSTGLYKAPAVMPTNSTVTITAALVSNPAVTASYQLLLRNPAPVVAGTQPTQLLAGAQNSMLVQGNNFSPQTVVFANKVTVVSTYLSPTEIIAQVSTATLTTGSVTLVAQNPAPGGGTSAPFRVPISAAQSASAQVLLSPGRVVPPDFVGLSHEWTGLAWMFGATAATGPNNIYRQLLRNLINGATYPFFIRIGGNSSDTADEMSEANATALASLANDLGVHYSLGINLAADNPQLSLQQAQFYLDRLPSGSITAFELGNEPDNYAFEGYRPRPYTNAHFLADYSEWAQLITPSLPANLRFMGPSLSTAWALQQNGYAFELKESANVSILSAHVYGGYRDGGQRFAANYLLTPAASTSGPHAIAANAQRAHKLGQTFRIGEINSIDASGIAGISDAFGSALWAIDTMFEYVKAGADGVNWHGNVNTPYCMFGFGNVNVNGRDPYTLQRVAPLYYGLLFFQLATANNGRMLPVTLQSKANVKVWSTLGSDGLLRIAVLNKDPSFTGNVNISVSGYSAGQLLQLIAPSYQSTDGVTIGGQTFDGSVDGNPIGNAVTTSLVPVNGVYSVPVEPASAVLLTLAN